MALLHLNERETPPPRVVVLGAGFVGGATARRLSARGVSVEALGSRELNLLDPGVGERLADLLSPETSLVLVSAKAPVRTEEMLIDNLRMLLPVREALARVRPAHLVYVSSDAVYADSMEPLTEESCAEPGSLHGVMHLAREIALSTAAGETPFAVVRPSLLYGPNDPHNGYGPNRFRRLAARGEPIVLFGEGEERRDHVFIEDVGELIARTVMHRSRGVLNIATGSVVSFREIAEKVNALAGNRVDIRGTPRQGPMPHNGYRPFNAAATRQAFPDFAYTDIDTGLRLSRDGDAA